MTQETQVVDLDSNVAYTFEGTHICDFSVTIKDKPGSEGKVVGKRDLKLAITTTKTGLDNILALARQPVMNACRSSIRATCTNQADLDKLPNVIPADLTEKNFGFETAGVDPAVKIRKASTKLTTPDAILASIEDLAHVLAEKKGITFAEAMAFIGQQ